MTGASDARSFSCWTSASKASSSPRVSTSPTIWPTAELAGAVQPLERRFELGRACATIGLHLAPGHHPERADRVLVGRVGHRQRELGLVLAHRQRPRLAQEARRDALLEDRELRDSRRRRRSGSPSCAASASATSRCAHTPSVTSSAPELLAAIPAAGAARVRARRRRACRVRSGFRRGVFGPGCPRVQSVGSRVSLSRESAHRELVGQIHCRDNASRRHTHGPR